MISRRELLKFSGAVALSASTRIMAEEAAPPDYRLDIATVTLDLSAKRRLRTTAYNGQAPGPMLRLKEGRPVTIEVTNHTDHPEVVHWHGLFLPPEVDGSLEEGTPPVPPGSSTRITFTPAPAGFRWYHSHAMSMGALKGGLYSGQHGLLMIEPRNGAGAYDREFFVALQDWDGYLSANEDGAMNPSYAVSTINGKMMGSGEPLRVRQGERVLLHVANTSATEPHWIALAGHELRVVALDGNVVPSQRPVPMLRLAPAERVCALVEMNNPGVWILGEVRKHVQAAGMGIMLEYADRRGPPRWQQPSDLVWNYEQFAAVGHGAAPSTRVIPLIFESRFRGHGAMEGWTINGKSFPETHAEPLVEGQRYRLQFINKSHDDHPLHLHRHSFELRRLGEALDGSGGSAASDLHGVLKDVVLVDAQTRAEVEFTADHPGATLFHCHQQSHMDAGFMLLFTYA